MERRESIQWPSGRSDRVPDRRKPRAAKIVGRESLALQEVVGVMVPVAVREIVPEHGGGSLCFLVDPEPKIGLDQAIKRFWRMARRLVILEHVAKAIDGGGVIAAVE